MADPQPRQTGNGGDLGFEADLFKAADKLRGNMEPSDYKHVALGLIFLKHISDGSEGKRSGEFYTPRSVVRVLVEMLEPFPDPARGIQGRVYDPCCGSGGMFVQAERFLTTHGGRIGALAIYGQESNYTTWRLFKMNLAVRGIDSDIRWNAEGSFHKEELADLRADFILANPPFNVSDWGGEKLREDARWRFGIPPVGNANFFGIYVRMYFDYHAPPHVHIEYPGHEAFVAIESGEVLSGRLPKKVASLVREW